MSAEEKRRKKKKKKRKSKRGNPANGMHKIISVIVAVVLILLIIVLGFGKQIKASIDNGEEIDGRWFLALLYPDKYAYSTEYADLNSYFGLTAQDDVAIILGEEHLEAKGKISNGSVYFALETAEKLFTDRFYYNENEGVVLYSTSSDIYTINLNDGNNGYTFAGSFTSTDYKPAYLQGETVYIALDYVKKFSNFEYHYYENPSRVQVYKEWPSKTVAKINHNTAVRYQGGIKSDILTKVSKDQVVYVLETMENWTKIRTEDGFTGYVENKKLDVAYQQTGSPVTGAYDPWADYGITQQSEPVVLAWHQIMFADDGDNLNSLIDGDEGITVVSPTWFYINSENGTFDNYATSAYVRNAHDKGYKVWGLVEDMTNKFDEYNLFSSSANRRNLINNLVSAVLEVGADGINIDCESVGPKTGPHFVQFLRELSIETRRNGLILSVDNYKQNQGNLYYDFREQAIVCDYVILMGYDEHWAGSEAGSVASIDFVEEGIRSAIDTGVPASELINGVPFYARVWKAEGSEVTSKAIGMTEQQEWLATRGLTPEWHDDVCQNYIYFEDGTAVYQVWFEDKDSLGAKLSVMSNYNLAGVACWKLGLENDTAWEVINQYY